MIVNVTTGICFLLVLFVILYDYYSKKRVNSLENKYFLILAYLNLFGLILDILIYSFAIITSDIYTNLILIRLILIYYIVFMSNLLMYFYIVSNKVKNKKSISFLKIKKYVFVIYLALVLLLLIFPSDYEIHEHTLLNSGDDAYFAYFSGLASLVVIFYILRKNKKKISEKNTVILFTILLLGSVSVVLQFYFPELLLLVPVHTIVLLLMYFSLENPDLKLIKKLDKMRKKADNANNAKSEFLANMSHEIRTPLNAVVGLSESILENEKISGTLKSDLEDIVDASNSLTEIVGNILDINKIESKKVTVVNSDFNIKSNLEKVIKINEEKLKNKEVRINVKISKSVPKFLYGDSTLIKTIFMNFISNAVKYTSKGSIAVTLETKKIDKAYLVIFSVKDTGIGIKKSDQDKLFKKFSRVNLKENIKIEGTGLGLVIVKNIVEILKGEITFESEFNKGSIFTVYIPVSESTKKESKVKEKVSKKILMTKKVLVVDDNPLNIKVFRRMLLNENVTIDDASDGLSAIEKIKNNEYDFIFLDIMMPELGGVETLKLLKKNRKFETPVIALTADATNDAREKYLRLGFNDYIAKPFKKEYLIKKLG